MDVTLMTNQARTRLETLLLFFLHVMFDVA